MNLYLLILNSTTLAWASFPQASWASPVFALLQSQAALGIPLCGDAASPACAWAATSLDQNSSSYFNLLLEYIWRNSLQSLTSVHSWHRATWQGVHVQIVSPGQSLPSLPWTGDGCEVPAPCCEHHSTQQGLSSTGCSSWSQPPAQHFGNAESMERMAGDQQQAHHSLNIPLPVWCQCEFFIPQAEGCCIVKHLLCVL